MIRRGPFLGAGDLLAHRFNPELGVGRVTKIDGRALVVEFPRTKTTLRIAANSDALTRIEAGADGSAQSDSAGGPERALADDALIGDVKRLRSIRRHGVGSFLGGRIRLFPHQLYVAGRATSSSGADGARSGQPAAPVRWLLADEVGLGKTIEACLILNRLVHTRKRRALPRRRAGRADGAVAGRAVAEVPPGVHAARQRRVWPTSRATSAPASTRSMSIAARSIALEMLIERPELTDQAVSAGIDLLVVDEAQRLRRPPGHPGEPAYRAIAPIAALGRHVLLLSATPLEDDAHGFFRLLQLLRPEEFPEDVSFEARLAQRDAAAALHELDATRRHRRIAAACRRPIALGDPASSAPHEWHPRCGGARRRRAAPARLIASGARWRRAPPSGACSDRRSRLRQQAEAWTQPIRA